jgi:hypothetical protein
VNVTEAKSILLLYRPGTADAEDPQFVEALTLARTNPELTSWLEAHSAAQAALRAKFRQVAPPAGLKEQIISEHAAGRHAPAKRPAALLAATILLLVAGIIAAVWIPYRTGAPGKNLASYQADMVSIALRGYTMDLMTNDPAPIRTFLATSTAPADFKLPNPLLKQTLVGCAVENWQGAKVSLVCFHTGKPLPPGAAADLWLFVVDGRSVKDAPKTAAPEFAKINKLITATWTKDGKLYFLGVEGGQPDIKQYLD